MRNEYIVDWSLVKKSINEYQYKGIRLMIFILWGLILVSTLALCILAAVVEEYVYMVCFGLMAMLSVYTMFFRNSVIARKRYKMFVTTYGKESWLRTISFEDNGIVLKEETTEIKYAYSQVAEIDEKDAVICLKLHTEMIVKLFRSKFIDCTWDDCKAIIIANNPNVKQKQN